nr:triple gene block protein 2 [Cowpea mild mottle virus]UZP17169.1 triple gene block 2 [Cowpea mild mottle virus]
MPLSPPPDHTKSFLALAVGIGLSLVVWALNRYTYPVAGDSQHRFPFGGCYRDGTKSAIYHRPSIPTSSGFGFGKLEAFLSSLLLGLLILCLSSRKNLNCHVCGRSH